jgi:hypothetical protein
VTHIYIIMAQDTKIWSNIGSEKKKFNKTTLATI